MRNPSQSGADTAESAAQGVHNVHTLILALLLPVRSQPFTLMTGEDGEALSGSDRVRLHTKR